MITTKEICNMESSETNYSINLKEYTKNQLKEKIKKLSVFQIANIVSKRRFLDEEGNPQEIVLNELFKHCDQNGIVCRYNSPIKKSGLLIRNGGSKASYLIFKSGKISIIGLSLDPEKWFDFSNLTPLKIIEMEQEINQIVNEESDKLLTLLSSFFKIKIVFSEVMITNIVWDIINVYNIKLKVLSRENPKLISHDPEIFIAATYKPFSLSPLGDWKGSFNIFQSRRSVYTGCKSVREFKEAGERFSEIISNSTFCQIPEEEYQESQIIRELNSKIDKKRKRKEKVPGKRGRKPKIR